MKQKKKKKKFVGKKIDCNNNNIRKTTEKFEQ